MNNDDLKIFTAIADWKTEYRCIYTQYDREKTCQGVILNYTCRRVIFYNKEKNQIWHIPSGDIKYLEPISVKKKINSPKIYGARLLIPEIAEDLPARLAKYNDWWWLQSVGTDENSVAFVRSDGIVRCNGTHIRSTFLYVRPALTIDTEVLNLKNGDCFIFDDKEFEVITKELAFCKSDIGQCRFDEKSNIYEISEVKTYIDEWFNEALAAGGIKYE